MLLSISLLFLSLIYSNPTLASVTVYYAHGQQPLAASTATAASANYTGAAAYNPTLLDPPPVPSPAIPTTFAIQLQNGQSMPGLSIPQKGSFFGFSVEFSVANQVLGKNSSFLQVPFLNLMSNIKERAGAVYVRVGGNTQEKAVLVPSLPGGKTLAKNYAGVSNPTDTPPLEFTPEILYMMSNISSLVNVRWYLGVPFNDTSNFRLAIAEQGSIILGDSLAGLQAGNEPDLYSRHGGRPDGYSPQDYTNEFGTLINAIAADNLIPNKGLLIGPSVSGATWTPEMVWDTGFVTNYSSSLTALAVEHYPTDNCYAQFGIGTPKTPQSVFANFLNHTASQQLVAPYINSANYAQTQAKQLIMFETNTASCGGFPGVSDSFGAALWGLDYAMQMAYVNFTSALFHVGGQNVFYNPFTPPPTNQSSFHQWTIGPIYYSALVMAEALGSSNTSQVVDLNANSGNIFTPAYAIYEGGAPARVMLFNYVTDPTGTSDYTASVTVPGGVDAVKVKYLRAPSVSQKGNINWAGQTFGTNFGSDGRLKGTLDIQSVTCANSVCQIKVPAPSVALVFLTSAALKESTSPSGGEVTFSTSAVTRSHNTATIDGAVLATSNGHRAMIGQYGSTSRQRVNGARSVRVGAGVVLGALVVGAAVIWGRLGA